MYMYIYIYRAYTFWNFSCVTEAVLPEERRSVMHCEQMVPLHHLTNNI